MGLLELDNGTFTSKQKKSSNPSRCGIKILDDIFQHLIKSIISLLEQGQNIDQFRKIYSIKFVYLFLFVMLRFLKVNLINFKIKLDYIDLIFLIKK